MVGASLNVAGLMVGMQAVGAVIFTTLENQF